MRYTTDKYKIWGLISTINVLLIGLSIGYYKYWYIFLTILALQSLINSLSIIAIYLKQFTNTLQSKIDRDILNYIYLIPVYNETLTEIRNNLNSLCNQNIKHGDKRMMVIVCDGKVQNIESNKTTAEILIEDILHENISECLEYQNTYKMWDGEMQHIDLYFGNYNNMRYVLVIKHNNAGKRDSLTLIRRLVYLYNQDIKNHVLINEDFIDTFYGLFDEEFNSDIKYIIGIDGDTIFDRNCTNELLHKINTNKELYGVVGFVDVDISSKKYSFFNLYQYAEYIYAQCLRRRYQSEITQKVNCLSGCVQVLLVSFETCGDEILNLFNHKPDINENIFNLIRSYASEDRNHVCLMFKLYPWVKTGQTMKAIAYTRVPNKIDVLMSQRRRWNLGAMTNDILVITNSNIIWTERVIAASNIIIWSLLPFVIVSTAVFLKSIISNPTMIMLYLSIFILVPIGYGIIIPIIRSYNLKETMYYYLSFITYITIGPIISTVFYVNSLINIDKFKWGKTRKALEL